MANDHLVKIIEKIVREVLIEKGIIPNDFCISSGPADQSAGSVKQYSGRSVLVLFSGTDLAAEQIFEQLKILSLKVDLRIYAAGSFLSFYPLEKLKTVLPGAEFLPQLSWNEITAELDRASLLLVPFLSRNTAAKAAMGIADSTCGSIIYQAIAKSKKIISVKAGADPDSDLCPFMYNLPKHFKDIFRDYISTLKKAGFEFIAPEMICHETEKTLSALGYERTQLSFGQKGQIEKKRAVITVEDVEFFLRTSANKVYVIPGNAIITPAAIDFINDKSVEIKYGE